MTKKLNLGAGTDIRKGWINHDSVALEGIDVAHDLNSFPWPWEDNSFDVVLLSMILEHLPDTVKVMEELHRITKPEAIVTITVPYWNSYESITDPTHCSNFNEFSMDFYDPKNPRCIKRPYYSTARYNIVKKGFRVVPFMPYIKIPVITRPYVFYSKLPHFILGVLASVFNNVILSLEFHLKTVK